MKKDLLNATVIQDLLETEQQTAKVGNASPWALLIPRCIWRGKWASQVAGFRSFPTCADRNGCEGDYSIHINSHKMEVVTIAVDKSTILEIRKTIALLLQSSLTALVGAIIKAKGIY